MPKQVTAMAGKAVNKSAFGPPSQQRRKRNKKGIPGGPAGDRSLILQAKNEEIAYMKTLLDPCAAPLAHGPYPGSRGYISRFSQYFTMNLGAGNTTGYVAFQPGTGTSSAVNYTNPSAAFTFSAGTSYVPGDGFLLSNANGVRCLGACVQLWSDAAPLNIQGNVFLGTIPWSELTGATSVQSFLNLANFQGKLTADVFEQKWYPGALDDRFQDYGTPPTATDGSSQNMIFVPVSGVPAASTLSLRVTWIVEWVPNASSGLNQAGTNTATGLVQPSTVVKKLHDTKPDWFTRVGNALNNMAPYIGKTAKLAAGVAGLLL